MSNPTNAPAQPSEQELGWRRFFTEREEQEIAFNHQYARMFHHGTDGHMARIIIAKMADLLDGIEPTVPPMETTPTFPGQTPA